jgi:aminopeptidase YwaD
MLNPVKRSPVYTFFLIMIVLCAGLGVALGFTLPHVQLDQLTAPVTTLTGTVTTKWPVDEMNIAVQRSDGRYLAKGSSVNWSKEYAAYQPIFQRSDEHDNRYLYKWRIPFRFSLPKDNYKVVVTIYRHPGLVLKNVLYAAVQYPPANEQTLVKHIQILAAPGMQGRFPGSAGGRSAAQYIAAQFRDYGLQPGGSEGYYQDVVCYSSNHFYVAPRWRLAPDYSQPVHSENVIGILPGKTSRVIVVSAHYDHLGMLDGHIFLGANDNASGVASILETARIMASNSAPRCTIIFAAWTGEEQGFLGSQRFVSNRPPNVAADVNLDSVGNNAGQLIVSGSVQDYQESIDAAAVSAGVKLVAGTSKTNMASDHLSFGRRGIPALNIYSPYWLTNNHTFNDDIYGVSPADLEKVTNFAIKLIDLMSGA